jgi:tetratricopeptide (TPR) repeat protein
VAAQPKLRAAEPLFQDKRYAEAGALYDAAVKAAPSCYVAYAYRGDAAFFQGQEEKALADYDKALALNPDDGSIYVFRANALQHLKRYPEMVDALRWSLALRPRNTLVLDMLHQAERPLHFTVRSVDIAFHGFARKEGADMAIYADAKRPAWLAYASCKALWLGEPSHRKAVLGTSEHVISFPEEQECIGALLAGYLVGKEHDDAIQEPELRAVAEIIQAGYGAEWVVYELLSRVDPQIVLTLPDAERKRMFEFVKRYVAVDDAAN